MQGREKIYEIELKKAMLLHETGFLGKKDTVWTIGSGPFGAETKAYGKFAGISVGIDPNFPGDLVKENCYYICKPIEEVLAYDNVPKPTIVISNSFSGINTVLPEILDFETKPMCILSPCGCDNCVEEYYVNSKPKSVFFQEAYPGMSYVEILARDPSRVDVIDMSLTAKGAGYQTYIRGFLQKDNTVMYLLLLSKDESIIEFFEKRVR